MISLMESKLLASRPLCLCSLTLVTYQRLAMTKAVNRTDRNPILGGTYSEVEIRKCALNFSQGHVLGNALPRSCFPHLI